MHMYKKAKNMMVFNMLDFLVFNHRSNPVAPKTANEKAGIKRILWGIAVEIKGIGRLTKKREKKESITVASEIRADAMKKIISELLFLKNT